MSSGIGSNMAYAGTKVLSNIIDYHTTTESRLKYLKQLLVAAGGDFSYVTELNADSIHATLKAHRKRVVDDGGFVPSMSNTLKAIIFALKNGLTSDIYSAYSPNFGFKKNGTSVIKVYDINGRDYELLSGQLEIAVDGKLNVIKNLSTSTMISKVNSIAGGLGMILGACVHDADAGSSSSLSVRGMYMSDNPNASGTSLGHIETNAGGQTRLYYRRQADDVLTSLPYDQTTNYKKFAGLVGYMSNSNTRVEIYENGALKAGATAGQKDISNATIYPTMSMLSLNSLFNESWIIKSNSQTLAIALSNYLNRST
ncbi:hypothetical protein [Acinetobacter baumannii]|uniref:hypothetical protein n=1 Tax=Acinetobacter baumannii TaxID=470 RepID=UPI00338F48AF